eukprot:7384138-Prymnesium_polylepis.1
MGAPAGRRACCLGLRLSVSTDPGARAASGACGRARLVRRVGHWARLSGQPVIFILIGTLSHRGYRHTYARG